MGRASYVQNRSRGWVRVAPALALGLLAIGTLPGGFAGADVPADLEVKKTALATPIKPGEALDFRISVKNIGSGAATNVFVNDLLPAGFSWFFGAPTRSECSLLAAAGGRTRLKCDVPRIDPGAAFVVRVKAFAYTCGDVSNTAVARSDKEPSILEGNNTSTAVISVICPD